MTPKPDAGLNLAGEKAPRAQVPLSKPAIPKEWQSLVSLPRPRNVYLTPNAKTRTVVGFAFLGGLALVFLAIFTPAIMNFAQQPAMAILGLAFTGFLVYLLVDGVRRDRQHHEVLSEGELTTGVMLECNEGRRGTVFLKYQFWTETGQVFEGRGTLLPWKGQGMGTEPLQVFYLPQNPKKNLALCCTMLEIGTR